MWQWQECSNQFISLIRCNVEEFLYGCYLQAFQEAGIDWFSFETIPAQKEGEALVRLLTEEFCDMKAWLSYTCQVYYSHVFESVLSQQHKFSGLLNFYKTFKTIFY